MNAITRLALTIPMPKITKVEVEEHHVVRVTWSAGIRANRTDVVDLSPMINSLRHYRPLRENRLLFRTVHLIEDGRILAWGDDDQIDMAADSVEELAEETMSPDELRDFLKANKLTHSEAGALLDRSRRQIENYLSGSEPIPRVFVMACFGFVARKQFFRGPINHTSMQVQAIDNISRSQTETRPAAIQNLASPKTAGPSRLSLGTTTVLETIGP